MRYRWRGISAHQTATGGRMECDPSELGWLSLTVHAETGDVSAELPLVASIEAHPDTGHRAWWAEGIGGGCC